MSHKLTKLVVAGLASVMLLAPLSAQAESRNGRPLPSRDMVRKNGMMSHHMMHRHSMHRHMYYHHHMRPSHRMMRRHPM